MRLAASTRETLDRHIERALRRRFGAGGNLRHVVRRVVLELATGGASDEAIHTLLRRSVEDHPQRYRWDRVSIVTGLTASSVLTRQMLHWAEQPAGPHYRRGRQCVHLAARTRESDGTTSRADGDHG